MKGKLFVLSAPAGTGKTTLVKRLTKVMPEVIQSISYTSRKKRPNEVDGVDYHFVTKEQFQKKLENGDFLEHAEIYGDDYGTDRQWVEERLEEGKHVFLVIDVQGAMQVKEKASPILIFVYPPSLEELERRLRHRSTETEDVIEKRLHWSKKELASADEYDYHIVNKDLDRACEELKNIALKN